MGGGKTVRRALGLALWLCGAAQAAEPARPAGPEAPDRVVRNGVAVDFSIVRPGAAPGAPRAPLQEGDQVEVRFRMTDAATGRPLAGVKPAAWMDIGNVIQGQRGEQRECKDKVALYLKGIVGIRPMVDLNSYYLLVLNQDPSISVIDPVVSMTGRTSLYATVVLKRPGADWTRSRDGRRLLVSMPRADEVAVVDAEGFKVEASVAAGRSPVRVALAPDGRRLWVGNDAAEPAESGVTALDLVTLKPVGHLATGRGHHELAFSADGRLVFATNREEGTVTAIDAVTLRRVKELRTGPAPISLAVSPLSRALYVADGVEGTIAVVDPERLEVVARLAARPGLGPLRATPDGRWILAVNPAEKTVFAVDAAESRLAHAIPVGGKPYQLAFTRAFAYVRLLDSERVEMVNLASLAGAKPAVQSFQAGNGAPQQAGDLSIAESVTQAALEAAVFVVNPAESAVYYYMEGMNAPMGSYGAYGHAARAVTVVDRSLQEVEPGVYAGKVRIPAAGRYDVAFLLENPSVLHCFSAEARPNPALQQAARPLLLDWQGSPGRARAGAPLTLRFRLLDPATRQPRADLGEVQVTWLLAPGLLRTTAPARQVGDGVYELTAALPRAGGWYFRVEVPSLGVKGDDLPFHSLIAEEAPAARP